jgi:predicted nucleic acid-binding protein
VTVSSGALPRVFLDTSIFVYAVGVDHPLKDPCVRLLHAIGDGAVIGETSTLVVQELVHQRLRRVGDRRQAAARGQDVRSMCRVHAVDDDDLDRALSLFGQHDDIDAADALHAAVALRHAADHFVSADRAFADIEGLTWLAPPGAVSALLP